jgi:hypothetical protein
LGSELRDPYERDPLYARERARRNAEMIYYSPHGEPTSSEGSPGADQKAISDRTPHS